MREGFMDRLAQKLLKCDWPTGTICVNKISTKDFVGKMHKAAVKVGYKVLKMK
jgi:hypothetical protein